MSTLRPADGLAARDLDRHLINHAGVLVDAAALAQLPATRLSGADPFLLATGAPVSAAVPAPLLRLLMRAGSMAVPCALVTEQLGRHVTAMLAAQRIPNVWSASVSAAEYREQGTNPYRAAARALRLPVGSCLIIATDLWLREARASRARRVLISSSGSLSVASKTTDGLSPREHDVALQLALGHTYEGVAGQLGCSASAAANLMSRVMRRRGLADRTRTIADLIMSELLDTAELRAALPDRLPELAQRDQEVLTLLATHEVRTVARMTGINQDTIGGVITRATTAIGARTRTHAVVMVLLLGKPGPVAASGGAPCS
ncbi:hypothetical protein ACIPLC_15305 [Kitasatospora sp. NPDC086801]|uniref:helix-turn-helix transcriptional regulator n=1 Tax=Kitasatospora sp. NPDC086801 TaxID=3364066 RepID=UPI0037FE9539